MSWANEPVFLWPNDEARLNLCLQYVLMRDRATIAYLEIPQTCFEISSPEAKKG